MITTRAIAKRPLRCVICGESIVLDSVTSPHPGAPEMLRLPQGAWIGFAQGDTTLEIVVVCTKDHADVLLEQE